MLKRLGSGAPILMLVEVGGLDKFEVPPDARCIASQKVHEAFPGGTDGLGLKGPGILGNIVFKFFLQILMWTLGQGANIFTGCGKKYYVWWAGPFRFTYLSVL